MSLMSPSEFARHIGRVPGYVTQLKDAGRLVMEGQKIDAEKSIQLIEATADPSAQQVKERHQENREAKTEQDELTGRAGSAYQQARAMREKYNALSDKMSYEKSVGLLLVAQEVKMAIASGDAIIRNRLESLPDILAPQVAAERDEQKIRAILADQIEYVLEDLSRTFYEMGKT